MIIGLSGKKHSGKTTLANHIIAAHPTFEIRSYAQVLKEVLSVILGIPADAMDDPEVKSQKAGIKGWRIMRKDGANNPLPKVYASYGDATDEMMKFKLWADKFEAVVFEPTIRELLQMVGTDLFREKIHPNIWVDALMRRYSQENDWVIADVRFPNEAAAIKKKGGILVRVERPSIPSSDLHPSETALDDYKFDYIIQNTGTEAELFEKFETLYEGSR